MKFACTVRVHLHLKLFLFLKSQWIVTSSSKSLYSWKVFSKKDLEISESSETHPMDLCKLLESVSAKNILNAIFISLTTGVFRFSTLQKKVEETH